MERDDITKAVTANDLVKRKSNENRTSNFCNVSEISQGASKTTVNATKPKFLAPSPASASDAKILRKYWKYLHLQ